MIKLATRKILEVLACLFFAIAPAAPAWADAGGIGPELLGQSLRNLPKGNDAVAWKQEVEIHRSAIGENFLAQLPDGKRYVAARTEFSTNETLANGANYSTSVAQGKLLGAQGERAGSYLLSFTQASDGSSGVYGIFSGIDGSSYVLHGANPDTAILQKEDLQKQEACGLGREIQNRNSNSPRHKTWSPVQAKDLGENTGGGGAVVPFDVAFMVTPQVESEWGGYAAVLSMIHVMVAQANNAYANSAILLRMNLAGVHELSTNGSGDIYAVLDHLSNPTDGEWDEVPAVRTQLGADLVALVYQSIGGPCGLAQMMTAPDHSSENLVYSVTQVNCISGYTFPHEIAHNMGAHHSIEDGGQGIFPYSHGFKHYAGPNQIEYATIMSYPPGFRIPHFSNPAVYFEGDPNYPTGIANQADNARTLNITGPIVAAYRQKTILHVPGQYSSIQAAINAAVDGVEIQVAPGTYTESLLISAKAIRLVSSGGPEVTVLRSTGGTAVLRFVNSASSLEGFTVRGNLGTNSAIQCVNSQAIIKGNTIRENILQSGSTTNGAGVNLSNCSGALINNLFINNVTALGKGGAVSIESGSAPLLQNNIIVENSARATKWYLGGGPGGGGVYIGAGTAPKLVNNTISNNRAPGGGGVYVDSGALPSIQNCILSGNLAPVGDMQDLAVHAAAFPTVVFSMLGDAWPGFGNIVAQPKFQDRESANYELRSNAPGIDQASGELAPVFDALERAGYDDPGADNAFYSYDFGNHSPRDMGALEKQTPSLAPEPSPGKLRNGDFRIDLGMDYYPDRSSDDRGAQNNFPDGWEFKPDTPAALVYESPVFGGRAVHMHAEEGFNYVFQDIPVQYGKVYEVSGMLKVLCDSESCFATVLSECLDANHQLISGSDNCQLNTRSSDIQRITSDRSVVSFQVTADNYYGKFMRVYCAINPQIDAPPQLGTGDLDCMQFAVREIGDADVPPTPTPTPGHPGKERVTKYGLGGL